jgi:hypothetical protein
VNNSGSLLPAERIEKRIYLIRGQKVMFDYDLAELYEVGTRDLVKATQRNKDRFPAEFAFQLTYQEVRSLMCQSGTSNSQPSETTEDLHFRGFSLERRGGRRKLPYAYTEHGIVMLSSVLHSQRAVVVNVEIVRTFIRLRQILGSHAELARKLAALEQKCDTQFKAVFDAIRELMTPPEPPRRRIGFGRGEDA